MEALRFGPTAGAATPAWWSHRQCRGVAVQSSDGETSPPWRTSQSQRSRARPERMTVIELAADLIFSFCDAYRR